MDKRDVIHKPGNIYIYIYHIALSSKEDRVTATVNVSVLAPVAVEPAPFPGRKSYVALVFVCVYFVL